MSDFSVDMNKFIKKAGDRADKFMLEFVQDLAEEVIMNTPVDTGFLRSSWTGKIGSPDLSTTGEEAGASGATASALNNITASLLGIEGGDVYYINNNATYAAYVEFGTSKMAPRAMVRRAVNKAPALAKNALNRVKT